MNALKFVLKGLKKGLSPGIPFESVSCVQEGFRFIFTLNGKTFEAVTPDFETLYPDQASHLFEGVGRSMAFEISKDR